MDFSTLGNWLSSQSAPVLIPMALVALVFLFIARSTVHAMVNSIFLGFYKVLRIASSAISKAERQLQERNRVVLMEHGREHVERELEREFRRVHHIVERDLAGYPTLQLEITDQISSIEEDYKQAGAVPPPGPDWITAIEAVAKLTKKPNGEVIGSKVLEQIHKASQEQHVEILKAYRDQVRDRHQKLDSIKTYWRKLTNTVDEVGVVIQRLLDRSKGIDKRMLQYEEIVAGTDKAHRTLHSSSLTQFMISLIVMTVAVGGAFINFHLIALPMSETVSGAGRVAGMPVSDVAGMFIILLEATFGLMLMESLRITRLFPTMAALDEKILKWMAVIFFVFLLAFAFVEAALAFMRDQIAADNAALRQSLTGVVAGEDATIINEWIPMAGQMIMGFVLPFALAFAAIPLESLLHSGRTVLGHLLGLLLRLTATTIRMVAILSRQIGRSINSLYDLLIIPLIWGEKMIFASRESNNTESGSRKNSTKKTNAAHFSSTA